jgi:hypothetical protein
MAVEVRRPEGHLERVQDERRAHVGGELPATDHAREGVLDEREVDDAFPAAPVGEIANPHSFGRDALKSRSTRSGGRRAVGSGTVVRQGLPRRFAPSRPAAHISRLTLSRPTSMLSRRSAFQMRLEP